MVVVVLIVLVSVLENITLNHVCWACVREVGWGGGGGGEGEGFRIRGTTAAGTNMH